MVTSVQIRTAVSIGKLFQKTRREKHIELHTLSNRSSIPMDLLVKIESGNLLAINRNTKYIEQITNRIAKNLQINICEFYPPRVRLDEGNVVQLFSQDEKRNIRSL